MPVYTLEADYHPGLPWHERVNRIMQETKLGLRTKEGKRTILEWHRARFLTVLLRKKELPVPKSRFERILADY